MPIVSGKSTVVMNYFDLLELSALPLRSLRLCGSSVPANSHRRDARKRRENIKSKPNSEHALNRSRSIRSCSGDVCTVEGDDSNHQTQNHDECVVLSKSRLRRAQQR